MYIAIIQQLGIYGLIAVVLLVVSMPSLSISYLTFIKVGWTWKLLFLPIGWSLGLVIGIYGSMFLSQAVYNLIIYGGKTPAEIKAINESSSGSMGEGIGSFIILVIVAVIMVPLCPNIFTYLTANWLF